MTRAEAEELAIMWWGTPLLADLFRPDIGFDDEASAMDLLPSPVAWWEPGRTPDGMTVSEASATGIAAFLGLTSVAPVTESSLNEGHYGGIVRVNVTEGPVIAQHDVRMGNRRYVRFWGNYGTGGTGSACVFDLQDGVITATLGTDAVGTIVPLGAGWRCRVYSKSWLSHLYIAPCNDSIGTYTYQGDGRICWYEDATDCIQHRCSALADHVPLNPPTKTVAYHFAQSTPALQNFVLKADGSSPGGWVWNNKACIWMPNAAARTLVSTAAGLRTAMTQAHTFVVRHKRLAADAAEVPVCATAGGVPIVKGIDATYHPFLECGTRLTVGGAGLDTASHTLAYGFDPATNLATIWVDGALAAGPTALTPGGAITPTSVTMTLRSSAVYAAGLAGIVMSTAQNAAEHTAMLREAP